MPGANCHHFVMFSCASGREVTWPPLSWDSLQ